MKQRVQHLLPTHIEMIHDPLTNTRYKNSTTPPDTYVLFDDFQFTLYLLFSILLGGSELTFDFGNLLGLAVLFRRLDCLFDFH
jgi:hypothetical protein